MYTIALANQKGGVGKTTSCINLAAAAAQLGLRVLLIDSDPQGNTTSGLGVRKNALRNTVYEALTGAAAAQDCVLSTKWENLYLLPSNLQLAGAEFELIDTVGREACLKNCLAALTEPYDLVMIDCPPSLSMLTVNALTAAQGVVIPMQCEYYALEGLSQLMLSIRRVKQTYNPSLTILGILVNMYNGRLHLSLQVLEEIKKYYADKLFVTPVPRSVKLAEAPGFGVPGIYYDRYNRASEIYRETAREMAVRAGIPLPPAAALEKTKGKEH